MQKKMVLVLLLATLIAGGAFAQFSLSAGLGGTFTADFIGAYNLPSGYPKDAVDMNVIGGGFFAYFDATYVMFSLGMGFHGAKFANSTMSASMGDVSLTTFDIGVLGKYPIPLGAVTLFPMLGVDIKIGTACKFNVGGVTIDFKEDLGGSVAEYWTTVWFKLGVGADIPLGQKLYLRPMVTYGFGTLPKYYKEEILDTLDAKGIFHGLDVKVAVGYKF